ncbi:response regulator transcription factor [Staphylococcus sp. SQ8-PEA]|uniref:Response regulator transcription factor n=1 Tax=Staphylococcus marylandisciuri TaxID=2981529 RepID=A0ABT2QR68_9STAP|nr:response regulator transcription factor [Staphylococcus marylandisciuri]MCU5746476.1 response regulator transcription factor [Staphylococcus marylandisciuri]
MKIFIVEDDLVIAESLQAELQKWHYEVDIAYDFNAIFEEFQRSQAHLILLDINLPSFNGFHWCQEIRKISNVPIVFISSRTDNMDQIMAMQMGGDDFIEKPFDMSLTIAKIQALLRRSYNFAVTQNTLEAKGCKLYIDEAKVEYNGQTERLSFTELQIVQLLFQNEGKFVSKTDLIEKCWESEHFIDDNTLAVNINRLRKKLHNLGLEHFIENRKNVGYRI